MSKKGGKRWLAAAALLLLLAYLGQVIAVNVRYREGHHPILCRMGEAVENKGVRFQVNGVQEYEKEAFVQTFGEAAVEGEEDVFPFSEEAYYILVEVQVENPSEESLAYDLWNWDLTGETWHWAMNPRISRNLNGGEDISHIRLEPGEKAVYRIAYSFYGRNYRKSAWRRLHEEPKRLVQIYHPQLIEIELGGER